MNDQYPLDPPKVPKANSDDGLLQTVDLNQPVPVDVLVWDGARPGYLVQLRLDADLVDAPIALSEQRPGDVIQLQLSHHLLSDNRSYTLRFQATNNVNGVTRESPSTILRVDRTQPGATLLAPMILPTATFGDHLTGLIPGYAGMEKGDVIQILLNGIEGPTHLVPAEELTLRPVEITFIREDLHAHAGENVSIEYFVTDRAGNASITSLPTLVSVKL